MSESLSESTRRMMRANQESRHRVGKVWASQIDGWPVWHLHREDVPCAEEPSLHDPVLATGDDPRQHCAGCQEVGPFLLDLEEHDGYRFWCAACVVAREARL